MSLAAAMLPEFDMEMAKTRKVIERVPDDKFDWAPHPTSMTLGRLALHVVQVVSWAADTITLPELDLAPADGPEYPRPHAANRAELLALLDKSVASARAALAAASDEAFAHVWTLKAAGKTMFSMPRAIVVRGMILNHMIHHRAQLAVYFRMLGVPVPPIYGPSGDEGVA